MITHKETYYQQSDDNSVTESENKRFKKRMSIYCTKQWILQFSFFSLYITVERC
jgi:hypothetical protein